MFDAFDVQEFATSQEVYTQWTGRRAKSGQPLYVYKIGGLTKDKVNAYSAKADRLLPRMIVLSEVRFGAQNEFTRQQADSSYSQMMTAFVLPFCSALPRPHDEIPVDATVCIVDIADVSLSRFWALRSHMQRASTMATAYYPETLGASEWRLCRWPSQARADALENLLSLHRRCTRILLCRLGMDRKVVRPWNGREDLHSSVRSLARPDAARFRSLTRSGIHSSHEVLPTLTKHVDISNIPKRYGGELAWDFGDPVSLDAEGAAKVGLVEGTPLPRGTVRWGPDGFQLVGTGRTPEEIAQGTPAPREKAPIANGNGNAVKKDEGAEVFSDDDEEENWSIAEEGNDEDLADVTAKVGQL